MSLISLDSHGLILNPNMTQVQIGVMQYLYHHMKLGMHFIRSTKTKGNGNLQWHRIQDNTDGPQRSTRQYGGDHQLTINIMLE